MLTFACVLTGDKYPVGDVARLQSMVARNLDRLHEFICLTDRTDIGQPDWPANVRRVDISGLALPGWWGKMAVFDPVMRGVGRTIYLDLDSVIVGDLAPLAMWADGPFGICENFTRLGGHATWPCRFGSCAMVFAPGWGERVWQDFEADRDEIMAACPRGDQQAIELLVPGAEFLQDGLPAGFFLHYRDLKTHWAHAPPADSVVVLGDDHNPNNNGTPCSRAIWRKAAA